MFSKEDPLRGLDLAWTSLADSYQTISPSARITSCRLPA